MLNTSQRMVLDSIIKNPKVTTVDLALMANIAERTVHRAVEYLKENGLVKLMAWAEHSVVFLAMDHPFCFTESKHSAACQTRTLQIYNCHREKGLSS